MQLDLRRVTILAHRVLTRRLLVVFFVTLTVSYYDRLCE